MRSKVTALLLVSSMIAVVALVVAPAASAVNTEHPAVVNDDPSGITPDIENGRVNAIAQIGNRIVVGGNFSTVQNPGSNANISRPYLFAFNAATGVVDTGFVPNLNGTVESLAPGPGGTVFAGGSFTTVNGTGTQYRRLVQLDLADGSIIPGLQPRPNRVVTGLVVRGGWLYASGEFTTTEGPDRVGLARFNVNTAEMDLALDIPFTDPNDVPERDPARDGVMQVWKIDVTPDGSRLIAIGNFGTVGGLAREQIAILDVAAATPSVTSWQTDVLPFRVPGDPTRSYCVTAFPMYTRALDISPDGSYFALTTTGANRPNRLCDSLTRWEIGPTGPAQEPTWEMRTGGDSMHSVSVTGAAIYAGGHQQWVNNPFNPNSCGRCDGPYPGGIVRRGISAHDPVNGLPFSFNPGRNPRGKGVLAQLANDVGIYFGSDTDNIGGETHRKIAFLPLAGGVQVPANDPYTLPGDLFRIQAGSGDLIRYQFDGASAPSGAATVSGQNWSNARGAFALNGLLYTGWSNGTLTVRGFDGSSAGSASTINLHGLDTAPDPSVFTTQGEASLSIGAFDDDLADMTGLAFDQGRIYYTVEGDPHLYYRYFTPQSQTVGAELFVAATGAVWGNVDGFTVASGQLYFALGDGTLNRVAWDDGAPTMASAQPIPGASGWSSLGMFAFDASGAPPPPPPPPPGAIFADDFSTGMSEWDFVNKMTADGTRGRTAAPSGRVQASGQNGWAAELLPSPESSVCVSFAVNVQSAVQSIDLLRLRTAGNGGIARVFRHNNGTLRFRSDGTNQRTNTGSTLGSGWHEIELCGSVGASSAWDMYLDGSLILDGLVRNTGTTDIGRVQIGDNSRKTFTVNWDDVVVDHSPG